MVDHTTRDIYRIMFKYARINVANKKASRTMIAPYAIADHAMSDYCQNFGYDTEFEVLNQCMKAVLWAIHWRLGIERPGRPLWASDKRIGFSFGPDEHTSWWEGPTLPGATGRAVREII